MARVALAQGNLHAAMQWVQPLLEHQESGGQFGGVEYLRLIELTCFQVLNSLGSANAYPWLERSHTQLQAQAQAIADPVLRN